MTPDKHGFYLTPFDLAIASSILFVLILTVIFVEYSSGSVLVDNTKKRVLVVTAVIMDCYHNDTGCEVKAVETNRTEIGNLSSPVQYSKDYSKT